MFGKKLVRSRPMRRVRHTEALQGAKSAAQRTEERCAQQPPSLIQKYQLLLF